MAVATSYPGVPYHRTVDGAAVTTHAGCPDLDDEMLAGGYWLIPDDWERMAGQQPELMRKQWDVLCGPTDTSCSGAGVIGPKRMVDTHDGTTRDWVSHPWIVTYKTIKRVDPFGGRAVDINGDGIIDGADDISSLCGSKVSDGKFVDPSGIPITDTLTCGRIYLMTLPVTGGLVPFRYAFVTDVTGRTSRSFLTA